MKPGSNPQHPNQPRMIIGAGQLVSHVYLSDQDESDSAYEFNLFRLSTVSEVTHAFRPQDLRDIVKACQVLAFSIADDGWLSDSLREELNGLGAELDVLTQKWSKSGG